VPITTSGKEQRLSDYLRAMTFKLTPAEIQKVSGEWRSVDSLKGMDG